MLHAKITAYKGFLVCELIAEKSIEHEVATSIDTPGVIGQVVMQTEKFLGVSEEAIELLKKLKRGQDDIGDVDWFRTQAHGSRPAGHAFSWIGGTKTIKSSLNETSRSFEMGKYVSIPNEVPAGAQESIDNSLAHMASETKH